MKKIVYNLSCGIIGSLNSGREIFIEYLKRDAIRSEISGDKCEFLIVYKGVPIRIKVFLMSNIENIIQNYDKIDKLDILTYTLNLHDSNALQIFKKEKIEEIHEYFMFKGISLLVGVLKDYSNVYRISKIELINKAKELNVLYCFEIQNKNNDLREFYEKILNDFIFKFKYSSPESFDKAAEYGKQLIKQFNLQN
ncbi:MAG: hypothetical protein ACTSRI_13570 [Promethearchaeota archaeon]